MTLLQALVAGAAMTEHASADDKTAKTAETKRDDEYTIDELASVAKVPSRTIRFYQARGALMPPEIRGRVAIYGTAHVERLKLVAQLQDRGLRIDAIRDLLTSIDRGEVDLAEWLGVEQQMQAPWANDRPRTVTEAELFELTGSKRHGLVSELVRSKLIERKGDVFLVESPALLTLAMKLQAVGVDLDAAFGASEIVRKQMTKMSKDLVDFCVRAATNGDIDVTDTAKTFEALRPIGMETVRVHFGREMERVLRALLESGKLAELSGKVHRAKKKKQR
ncbi:MAG: MerR family transcriptional regulator [Polyangiales bacterium]